MLEARLRRTKHLVGGRLPLFGSPVSPYAPRPELRTIVYSVPDIRIVLGILMNGPHLV